MSLNLVQRPRGLCAQSPPTPVSGAPAWTTVPCREGPQGPPSWPQDRWPARTTCSSQRQGPVAPAGPAPLSSEGGGGFQGPFPPSNPQRHQFPFQPPPHFLANCPASHKTCLIWSHLRPLGRALSTPDTSRASRKFPIVADGRPPRLKELQEAIGAPADAVPRAGLAALHSPHGPRKGLVPGSSCPEQPLHFQILSHAPSQSGDPGASEEVPGPSWGWPRCPRASVLRLAPQPVSADSGLAGQPGLARAAKKK